MTRAFLSVIRMEKYIILMKPHLFGEEELVEFQLANRS